VASSKGNLLPFFFSGVGLFFDLSLLLAPLSFASLMSLLPELPCAAADARAAAFEASLSARAALEDRLQELLRELPFPFLSCFFF
jgi:hypothetical protein